MQCSSRSQSGPALKEKCLHREQRELHGLFLIRQK